MAQRRQGLRGIINSPESANPEIHRDVILDAKETSFELLTEDQRRKQSFSEWVKEAYNEQYEKWMPWLEEQYLKWFGKGDNKASYVTEDTLSKSKVTGIKQVDQVQDDVHNLVGNQLGENGPLAPVGNMASKEGINRAKRKGKDENGSYGGPLGGVTDPVVDRAKGAGQSVTSGAQTVGNSISGGFQSAGNWFKGSSSKEQQS